MKHLILILSTLFLLLATACGPYPERPEENKTAFEEQQRTEQNQSRLNQVQPAPQVSYSLERENLANRFTLFNDRSVSFFMYVFLPNSGIASPVLYYEVNKVSSVNSQMTNPNQIVITDTYDTPGDFTGRTAHVLASPAEDGSYGTNGDAVFGFTPDMMYVETNLPYIVTTAPVSKWHETAQKIVASEELANRIRQKLTLGD